MRKSITVITAPNIFVDYRQPMGTMIAESRCPVRGKEITASDEIIARERRPSWKGIVEFKPCLFNLGREISSEGAALMARRIMDDGRPWFTGELEHARALDSSLEDPIVVLGSIIKIGGVLHVPCLKKANAAKHGRDIVLSQWEYMWGKGCYFFAVSEVIHTS